MKMKGIKTKIYQLKNICTWLETLFKWYDKWSKLSKRFEKDYQKLKSNNKSKKIMQKLCLLLISMIRKI